MQRQVSWLSHQPKSQALRIASGCRRPALALPFEATRRFSSDADPSHSHRNWAQIGRGIETIKSDLGDGFFSLQKTHFKGLTDWSIYHKNVTFSDPFHYGPRSNSQDSSMGSTENGHTLGDSSTGHSQSPLLDQLPPVIVSALPKVPDSRYAISQFGRGGYLVRGRIAYGLFVAVVRMALICYYDDADLEIVRCKSVSGSGPLQDADLADLQLPDGENVWKRDMGNAHNEHEHSIDSVRLVVRWIFEGTPRHRLLYSKVLSPLSPPKPVVYEGVFVYQFDNTSGLVLNHSLQRMSPKPWVPAICKWWIKRAKQRATQAGQRSGGVDGVPQLNSVK